jgi:hypothetical protein
MGLEVLPLRLRTIIRPLRVMDKENVQGHQHLPPLLLV